MPAVGKDLLAYLERVKRKANNKKERETLLKYLGGDEPSDSEASASESEDDSEPEEDVDTLAAPEIDIPTVSDIPVVSQLAK